MESRTYRAERFDEALAKVKRDLGPGAVILSSRQVPSIDVPGGRRMVEVKAVAETVWEKEDPPTALHRRWRSSEQLELALRAKGVPTTQARNLALHIHRETGGKAHSLREARETLAEALRESVSFGGPLGDSSARVMALVGPTGVGKTTTIAKLAAQAALVERRSVGLISIDRYRVAGAEQLERYADLIGIPMLVAHDVPSLTHALQRLASAELVLIDTAGRTPRDREALFDMARLFEAMPERIDVHLCFEAAMREAEMQATVDRLAVFRPVRLNITKLDEAVSHGGILSMQVGTSLPIAYFTVGQRVPEDIEVASPERLAALLSETEVH